MGVGGQRHTTPSLPPRKTRYPLYRALRGPQGRSGRVRKISSLPGFDPQAVQPVASRYTDWAIAVHIIYSRNNIYKKEEVHINDVGIVNGTVMS